MSADDMLDQSNWHAGVDVPHLLVEHGDRGAELRARRLTADRQIRAAALQAAATWLSGVDPYPQRTGFVLETAERFETWIRDVEDEA